MLMTSMNQPETNIEQQVQVLIDNAPPDGVTPKVMKDAIAPILILFAQRLAHPNYFILQTLDQGWVMTTLSNRSDPNTEKRVIYAFPTLEDAKLLQGGNPDPQIIATAIPVTHILFQMFALKTIDSTIFMETPGDLNTGKEVKRADLQKLVQIQLQKLGMIPDPNVPPNLA
jgi:hypothetical protein